MSASTKLTYHVVFSTKHRLPLIKNLFCQQLYEYIGGIVRAQKGFLIEIGGIEDHIHILLNISPIKSVSDAIRDIKANSSKWCNQLPNPTQKFEWQKGYGAFTVSYHQIESVRKYIQNQRAHHQKKTFQEEYIEFLNQHNIAYELKYVFNEEYYS